MNQRLRGLEVVVDGLPLFQGAQLAVDTTLVPLTREGAVKPRSVGVCLRVAKETCYLATEAGLVWLCSRERLEDASPRKLHLSFVDWVRDVPELLRDGSGCVGGVPCWPAAARAFALSYLDRDCDAKDGWSCSLRPRGVGRFRHFW